MTEETAKLYAWATARCARSEACRADIRLALARRSVYGEAADSLLDRLEDEGYIDEARYARAFVHDRSRYDRWGRIKIGAALRQKNIASSLINAALQTEIDETEYAATLRALLAAKRRSVKADTPEQLRQKLVRFAASRGFEADLIFQCIDQLEETEEDKA